MATRLLLVTLLLVVTDYTVANAATQLYDQLFNQLCNGQIDNHYSPTSSSPPPINQGPPGKKGPKGDKGESSTYYANEEKNRRFASKIATLHKQLTTVQVENQHLQLQLNETENKFKNENEVLSTKLEKTEQLLNLTEQKLSFENQHLQIQLNETEKKFKNENEVLSTKLEKTEQLLNSTEQKLSNQNEVLSTKLEKTEQLLNSTEEKLATMEKKFDNYKAETDSRLSELSELICSMKVPKSCEGVTKCQNTPRNGTYSIQPDSSLPAFDVECSFNGNTATTTIHHNSEEEIEVSGDCDPAKCYGRNIVYDATIPQIRALISLSGFCRQYIKYRCYDSRIFYNGDNFAGWETWDGTMRHYWGGSGGRDGYCACGITGTCADTSRKCNCDKNDSVWREDEGFLDQEEDLPATKIYFGDANTNEYGYHTLGTLQCQQSL